MKKINMLAVSLVVIMMFILTGCGTTDAEESLSETEQETTENVPNEDESVADDPLADERIIAGTYAIAEVMDVLDIDLVGVSTTYKELPTRYEDVPEIGNPMWPDMEIVMSLKPTNVLTVTTLKEDLEEDLNKIGAPVTFLDFTSVSSMLDEIEAIGKEYHREEEAADFVADYKAQMAVLESNVDVAEKPKVLILMGIPGSYIVGTEHSYIGDLVERAGGTNAVTGRDEEYISGNTEYLQQLEPDVILRAAHGAPQEVIKMFDKEFVENDVWKHFKAVKDDRVYDLEETRFGTTANLAALDALEELIQLLHAKK